MKSLGVFGLSAVLTAALLIVIPITFVAGRRHRMDRQVRTFADGYAAPLTSATEPVIAEQLARSRRWRIIGAIVTVIVVGVVTRSGIDLLAIIGGVALGSVAAEVFRRPEHGTRRTASLATRRASDHVQPFVIWLLVGASIVLLGATTLTAVSWATLDHTAETPSRLWFVSTGGFGVLAGLIALFMARQISRRPETRDDPAAAAVHHAIRSSSIMSVIGGGLLAVGIGLYQVGWNAGLLDGGQSWLHQWADNLTVFCAAAAVIGGAGLILGALPRRSGAIGGGSVAVS